MDSEKMKASPFPIKTVVVLVQENRSFDHMLGWMKSVNPEIDGVTGQEWNPISTTQPDSAKVYFGDRSGYVAPDPGHSFQAIFQQIFGNTTDNSADPPPMNGFAQEAESEQKGLSETVMNGFRPEKIPVYKALVSEFAVFDRWFAAVPTSTQPNRSFVHSATSHGLTSNETKKLIEGLPQKTIFDSLHEAGHDFAIYYQFPPSVLYFRNLRKLKYITKFHPFDLSFKKHCQEGKLPSYVVIENRYFDFKLLPGNDDHPSHNVFVGQKFVKEVYEALRSSPQWNEILFIITYDEHGGFYDHVPTPVRGVPSPDGIVGPAPFHFKFNRLGVRVPTIMISPWIEKGTVVHGPSGPFPSSQFEHSSIPATVKKIFNLQDFLTQRDAWAGSFESIVLARSTPRTDCPAILPLPEEKLKEETREESMLSSFQMDLVQLGAQLNGDHRKGSYPDQLVEGMTVAQGAEYAHEAFKTFREAAEHCRRNGMEEDEIISVDHLQNKPKSKSFLGKVLACVACSNAN